MLSENLKPYLLFYQIFVALLLLYLTQCWVKRLLLLLLPLLLLPTALGVVPMLLQAAPVVARSFFHNDLSHVDLCWCKKVES